MNKVLKLTFTTVTDKTQTFTIANPRADLTGAAVAALGNTFVTQNCFDGDALSSLSKADVIETVTTPIVL